MVNIASNSETASSQSNSNHNLDLNHATGSTGSTTAQAVGRLAQQGPKPKALLSTTAQLALSVFTEQAVPNQTIACLLASVMPTEANSLAIFEKTQAIDQLPIALSALGNQFGKDQSEKTDFLGSTANNQITLGARLLKTFLRKSFMRPEQINRHTPADNQNVQEFCVYLAYLMHTHPHRDQSIEQLSQEESQRFLNLLPGPNSASLQAVGPTQEAVTAIRESLALRLVKKDGVSLRDLPDDLHGKMMIVQWAIINDANEFNLASVDLRNNSDIQTLQSYRNGHFTLWRPRSAQDANNFLIVLAAVKENGIALQHASNNLKNDRDIVLAAVNNHHWALAYAGDEAKNDREIVLAAVHQHGSALQHAGNNLKNDRDIVLAAVNNHHWALAYAGEEAKNDREIVLAAVQKNGTALEYAGDEAKNDRDIVLAAVQTNGFALQHAGNNLKNDRDIVLAAVNESPRALECASDEAKKDRDIVLAAVQKSGTALAFAGNEAKNDRDIVLAAVNQSPWAIYYAGDEAKNDRDIVLAAVQKNGKALLYAGEKLRNDPELIELGR